MSITFGRVKKPNILTMICDKPATDGAGFTLLSRPRVIVGSCEHITDGRESLEWYQKFFSTGGQRAWDALVDFLVDTDGRIGMFNDPWGVREPWANGGSDGLEGDGPAFVQKFGVFGINANLASIEHVGLPEDVWPQVQWDAAVQLTAWLFDRAKVRWDSYPVNQNYGVVTHMLHFEFATKPCPGKYLRENIVRYQDDVHQIMKAAQGTTDEPMPKPPTGVNYPAGMDLKKAKQYFGKMRDHKADGTVVERGFNEKGAISLAWLERGGKENAYPEARDKWTVSNGTDKEVLELVTFGNGWLLIRRADRAGWTWV